MTAGSWPSVACIYHGFNDYLVHKYKGVTWDLTNFIKKKKKELLTVVVKNTGTTFSAFAPGIG